MAINQKRSLRESLPDFGVKLEFQTELHSISVLIMLVHGCQRGGNKYRYLPKARSPYFPLSFRVSVGLVFIVPSPGLSLNLSISGCATCAIIAEDFKRINAGCISICLDVYEELLCPWHIRALYEKSLNWYWMRHFYMATYPCTRTRTCMCVCVL